MNTLSHPVKLTAGSVITDLEAATVCDAATDGEDTATPEDDPILIDMVDRVDDSVSDEDRAKLMSLLTEFRSTFSRSENDLGRTYVITHVIDTGDGRPVRQLLQRHPPAHLDAIHHHVTSILEHGVIEPARSPWASNIVLVKKKDGSL